MNKDLPRNAHDATPRHRLFRPFNLCIINDQIPPLFGEATHLSALPPLLPVTSRAGCPSFLINLLLAWPIWWGLEFFPVTNNKNLISGDRMCRKILEILLNEAPRVKWDNKSSQKLGNMQNRLNYKLCDQQQLFSFYQLFPCSNPHLRLSQQCPLFPTPPRPI